MRRKIALLIILAVLALALSSCAGEKLNDGALLYKNDAAGFKVQYPNEWDVSEDGGTVVFTSPLEGSADSFAENISVSVEKDPASSAEEALEAKLGALESEYDSVGTPEKSYPVLAGEKGFAFTVKAEKYGTAYKIYTIISDAGGKQVTLIYSALYAEYDRYALHLSIVKSTVALY